MQAIESACFSSHCAVKAHLKFHIDLAADPGIPEAGHRKKEIKGTGTVRNTS